MNLISLAIWLALIIFLSTVIDFLLKSVFRNGGYRIFVAPGVILHELAHGFVCLITGAKVKEINFFDRKGGFVKHEKSKLPIIGPVIISLAPLLIGIVVIFILSRFIIIAPDYRLELSLTPQNLNRILSSVIQIHLTSARSLIAFYFLVSICTTMAPSFRDFANAFLGLIFLLLVTIAVNYFFVIKLPETTLILVFSLVTTILIVALIFSIILYVIRTIFS